MSPDPRRGTSPSALADYAFCPRSHWYAQHPPAGGPNADGLRRVEAGARYHARALRGTRVRAELGGAYWVLVAVGVVVAAGGLWWLIF